MNWLGYALVPMILLGPVASMKQNTPAPRVAEKPETTQQEHRQFQDKANAKLRELDREIAALKIKASHEGREAKKEYDRQLPELEKKRAVAEKKFEELKNSSQEAWVDMKDGMNAALGDLETAYKRAASHFN